MSDKNFDDFTKNLEKGENLLKISTDMFKKKKERNLIEE